MNSRARPSKEAGLDERIRVSNQRKMNGSTSKVTAGRKVLVRLTLGSIGLLTVAIALVVTGACSESDSDADQDRVAPASSSTSLHSTPTSNQTSPVISESRSSASRAEVREVFEAAGFQFYGHGSLAPDWYSGDIWDGSGVSIEIFGPEHQVDAVELWMNLDAVQDDGVGFALAVGRVAEIFAPSHVQELATWTAERMPELPDTSREGFQGTFGGATFSLQITESLNQVLLSVEPNH